MNLFHLPTMLAILVSLAGIPANTPLVSSLSFDKKETAPTKRLKEETSEFIPWTVNRILTWEDFQGESQRNSDAVASTSTSLGLSYLVKDGALEYEVTCNFSKLKSWGFVRTPYILAHEQAHFDITEIFARRLHQELQSYDVNKKTYRQDVNRIYQSIVDQKEAMQKAYDGETDHSRNRKLQEEWLNKIREILEETAVYSIYP